MYKMKFEIWWKTRAFVVVANTAWDVRLLSLFFGWDFVYSVRHREYFDSGDKNLEQVVV